MKTISWILKTIVPTKSKWETVQMKQIRLLQEAVITLAEKLKAQERGE